MSDPKNAADEQLDGLKYEGSVTYVLPSELEPFTNKLEGEGKGAKDFTATNPFIVRDGKDMEDLRKGIEEYGVLVPLTVRKNKDGKYELLSGYRRKRAVELINKERAKSGLSELKLPIVELPKCDEEQAIGILATSNTYRKNISLLEKVRACGEAYRAMRRKSRYSKDTKERAAKAVGEIFHIEAKQVQRYSALLNLNDNLLRLACKEYAIEKGENEKEVRYSYKTSNGKLKLSRRAGEMLSTLTEDQQNIIFQFLKGEDAFIPISEVSLIKKKFEAIPDFSLNQLKSLSENWMITPSEASSESVNDDNDISESKNEAISLDNLQLYFKDETPHEIRDKVRFFLEKWQEAGSPENFTITPTSLSEQSQ